MNKYPQYYRKANRVIKRDGDLTGIEIQVPEPGNYLPLIHTPVIYPDRQRFDEAIQGMEPTTEEVYEGYMATFFRGSERNRSIYNDLRQRRYDQKKGTAKTATV